MNGNKLVILYEKQAMLAERMKRSVIAMTLPRFSGVLKCEN
jgi:hypothetical protein